MPRTPPGVLLDTGVLVALLRRDDPRHEAASDWLSGYRGELHTTEAVLTETAYFLASRQRAAVADFAAAGGMRLHPLDNPALKRIGAILRKYTDLDPDWADATLVWLAEHSGIHRIATLDVRDFSAYRVHGRTKFLLESIA